MGNETNMLDLFTNRAYYFEESLAVQKEPKKCSLESYDRVYGVPFRPSGANNEAINFYKTLL